MEGMTDEKVSMKVEGLTYEKLFVDEDLCREDAPATPSFGETFLFFVY